MAGPRVLVLDRTEDLALQVKRVLVAGPTVGGSPDVVPCTQVAVVAQLLEDDGPYDVLIAGPSTATRTGLARVELIRQAFPLMSVVLAFDQRPEARLRDVIRAGAVDLLELPASDADLLACIERAVGIANAALEAAPVREVPAAAAPAGEVGAIPSGKGRVFTVASATGGCGKTFMATNLAYFLQANSGGKRVCLLDLDIQFGEVSTALRMRPRYTVYDALEREDGEGEALEGHIEEYMSVHETGFHVLAAPKDPLEAERISPPDVLRVIEAVQQRFDYVVVDTPAQLSEVVTVTLDLSEQLLVMTTLDLPSVRNMSVFLSTLERLRIPTDMIRLVLNKAESDVGIDIAQVERLFPQGFMAILPYAKEVSRSINLGIPVLASSPAAEISRRMAASLLPLLPAEQQAITKAAAPKKQRRFGRQRDN
jgi:pilus assembly protein CpaE